jgi:hypothetical protein
MSSLAIPHPALPPTAPGMIEKLKDVQAKLLEHPQVDIHTHHVLHGGMYARTITLPPDTVLVGAHVRVPTVVITVGTGWVLVGKDWAQIAGYQVLPASADRKQIFISEGPLIITAIFPTSVKTVEDAEAEFTDEAELLLSRVQDLNTVVITGE